VNGSPPTGVGLGLAGAGALVVAGVAAVLAGNPAPTPPAQSQTPKEARAVFEPKKLSVAVEHDSKSLHGWSRSVRVRVRGLTPSEVPLASTHLGSGDGAQLEAKVTKCDGKGCILHIDNIPRAGEYTGTLALKPTDPSSAALELTVRARHPLWVPLLLVFVVALVVSWLRQAFKDPTAAGGGRFATTGAVARALKRLWTQTSRPVKVVWPFAVFVAALAFLLPVYAETNFGLVSQYLSVAVAAIVGKVVIDESLQLGKAAQVDGNAGEAPLAGMWIRTPSRDSTHLTLNGAKRHRGRMGPELSSRLARRRGLFGWSVEAYEPAVRDIPPDDV
jgi:hypothetical protein